MARGKHEPDFLNSDLIDGVRIITDAKPDSLPVRDPAMMYCNENHLWVLTFAGGNYFCSNCEASVPDKFLRDFLSTNGFKEPVREGGFVAPRFVLIDDIFEAYLAAERENIKKGIGLGKYKEAPDPRLRTSLHSFILGTSSGSRWDRCTVDGHEIYASKAKVELEPGSVPTVELTVLAHHLKEYLDSAFLDLAILQRDGSVVRISQAAFVPRDEDDPKKIRDKWGYRFPYPDEVVGRPQEGDDSTHAAKFFERGPKKKADEKTQVGRLADFIMAEVPGEPSKSEGAIDTAIRLLRKAYADQKSVNVKINVDATEANKFLKRMQEKLRADLPKILKAETKNIPIRTGKLRSSFKKGK